ncbi:MAG: hypothetical protein HY775_09155 [Acidobacteria bacterium]|nr:hypothetical protein [Acidobacteriota bacterium]
MHERRGAWWVGVGVAALLVATPRFVPPAAAASSVLVGWGTGTGPGTACPDKHHFQFEGRNDKGTHWTFAIVDVLAGPSGNDICSGGGAAQISGNMDPDTGCVLSGSSSLCIEPPLPGSGKTRSGVPVSFWIPIVFGVAGEATLAGY